MAPADDSIPDDQKDGLATEAGLARALTTTFDGRYRAKDGKAGIEKLDGGTANYVYRVKLENPIEDKQRSTVIVKHAEDFIRTAQDWHLDARRADVEYVIMSRLRGLPEMQADDLVRIPEVYAYNQSSHTLVMEDLGTSDTSKDLKAFIQTIDNKYSSQKEAVRVCEDLGKTIGAFLAALHAIPLKNVLDGQEGDIELTTEHFDIARDISGAGLYGRVRQTLESFAYSEDVTAQGDEIAQKAIQEIKNANEVFTHGDYWTGNVLVRQKADQAGLELNMMDWEMSKPGTPAYDLGQFIAEAYCLYKYAKSDMQKECSEVLLAAFERKYLEKAREAGKTVDLSGVAVRVGAHLIVWTPVTGWTKDADALEEVVKEGVHMLIKGSKGDVDYLRSSVVLGPFFE